MELSFGGVGLVGRYFPFSFWQLVISEAQNVLWEVNGFWMQSLWRMRLWILESKQGTLVIMCKSNVDKLLIMVAEFG